MGDKMRVHVLARELNVTSRTIIEKCQAEGITSVKNHMSTLSAGLHATLLEWFSEMGGGTAVETSERVDLQKVRIPRRRKRRKEAQPTDAMTEAPAEAGTATAIEIEAFPFAEAETQAPAEPVEATEPVVEPVAPAAVITRVEADVAPPEVADQPAPTGAGTAAAASAPAEGAPDDLQRATSAAQAVANVGSPPAVEEPEASRKPITPAGPQNIPVPAKLQGPRVVRYEAPDRNLYPVRRGPRPRSKEAGAEPVRPPATVAPGAPSVGKTDVSKVARRKGRFSPRQTTGRLADAGERLAEWRDRDLAERQQRLAGATGRRIHQRRTVQDGSGAAVHVPAGPKTSATVHEPIRMKEFCAATGLNFIQLLKALRDEHNIVGNLNMTLPPETAELLALQFGIDLAVVASKSLLDELEEEFAARQRTHEQPRPPVVTLLGHVDHGKTSLLDAIRKTHVAEGEDGGITQHISSYHIRTGRGAVTFVDTPGHAAFTAMRARGAEVTDVVVLVVAADDGVMPQTIEAIRHAQTAEVPVVVALNKIDLGDENKLKIFGQLAERGLTPSGEWGGEVDVIPTSATTGEGVAELVEHLADLSGLLELRADPALPSRGIVIEAETKAGVGPMVQVLIQEGTLRVGDFVVCGSAYGKVRALLNDRGERLKEAGPSIPVEVWGLDDVPTSGDTLYQLKNLQRAKGVATETKQSRLTRSRAQSTKVKSLEEMFKQRGAEEIAELNMIVKADVDGSVAALQSALGQFPSDEVKLVIRHAAVGAVNDSDVLLAEACKGIVVAFRVDTPSGVRKLAEQHGVDIRSHRVIYHVCDEIKTALEGLLKPEERIESRGSVEVRQVFHISKVGMIAGAFVVEGTVDRSHFAKVSRDGVVIRDRCNIASLKHFKDDVKKVRSGLECGIRLERFDDLHIGDIIETFEIVKIARTL